MEEYKSITIRTQILITPLITPLITIPYPTPTQPPQSRLLLAKPQATIRWLWVTKIAILAEDKRLQLFGKEAQLHEGLAIALKVHGEQ